MFCFNRAAAQHKNGIVKPTKRYILGKSIRRQQLHISTGLRDSNDNFLPESHPVILRHNDTNKFYLNPEHFYNSRELTNSHGQDSPTSGTGRSGPKSFSIIDNPSQVRLYLQKQSSELKKMVFFYNETNPHAGLIGNLKVLLYDYFQLIGPVKDSWYNILLKNYELAELLSSYIAQELDKEAAATGTSTANCIDTVLKPPSVATIASMLESLASRKCISSCKYKSSVDDNLFQIHGGALSGADRAIIEVLAQYAHIDYEVIG